MYNIKLAGLDTGKSYYVKVRAKVFGYQDSEWSYPFKFETPKDTMPPGRVEQVSFISEGDSFIAKWDAPSVNEDGVTPCGDVSHYKITLKDLDRNVTRHEKTNDTSFTLDFNRNKQLFGNAAGRIELTVWAVDFSGNEGKTVVVVAQNPPPAKVKNVTAAVSVESIALKWDANTENDLANYEIHVGSTSGFTPSASTLRAKVAAGTDAFTYDTASLSVLYFKILAVDKFDQKSEPSDVVSAQPRLTTDYDKEPPGTVTGFTVTQVLAADNASATAQINYTAVADTDLDKYEVQYRKTGETTLPWSFAAIPSDQTMAEIKPLPLATSYDFRIRAVDFNANKGDWSAVVVAPGVKKTTLPAAPTGVTVRGGTTNLMVTWTASTDPSMASWAGTYEVQISKTTAFASPITIKTASTLASFISLDANTIYYVRIRSIDPYGNIGAWSTRAQGNTGQVADPNASRVIWSDTEPTSGKTNDLWIKVPENVQYRFDGTNWIKAQDTELAGEIDNVRQTADGKNKAWYQTTKPPATNNTQGDLWFDTANGNKLHVWSTSANDWVSAQDAAIQDALDNADEALQTADGKNTIFYSTPAAGAELREGDTWFDNAVIKVYKNGAWANASDDLDTAKARQAIQIAGSKNKTYYVAKASATGMIEGDILFDTADGNKQYRYNGTTWVSVTDAAIAAAEEAAGQAQETADKKNTIYYSTPPTTGLRDGDTWFDGPTIKTYRNGVWTDSSSNLETQQGADAIQVAGSKNKTYYTTFANRPTTGLTEGDLLFDTGDKYKQYRYTNAGWLSVRDGTIADAKTAADNAKAAAELRAQTFYEANKPANTNSRLKVNDLWIRSTDNQLHRWTGSDWMEIQDDAIALTQANLSTAVGDLQTSIGNVQAIADGKINTFISNTAPTQGLDNGDIWFDTSVTPVSTKVYDGTDWIVSGDKAALDAAAAVQVNLNATNTALNKKNTTYAQTSAPTANLVAGDIWLDTTLVGGVPKNEMNRWDGAKWVKTQDKTIFDVQALADGKATVFTKATMPTNAESDLGDIWFDTSTTPWGVKVRTGAATWTVSGDKDARDAAQTAQNEANRKIQSFYTDTDPATVTANNVKPGDLWYKISDKRARVRASNNTWVELKDADIKKAQDAADAANQAVGNLAGTVGGLETQVDKKVEVWFQTNQPAVPSAAADRLKMKGDIWINTSTGVSNGEVKMYPGTGTVWNVVTDPTAIAAAQAAKDVADSKRQVFGGELAPSNTTGTTGNNLQVNDLWIRDSDKKMHRWGGSAWEIAQDYKIDATALKGNNLVFNGHGELGDNTNWPGTVYSASDAPPGSKGSFVVTGKKTIFLSETIAVNPYANYTLSVWARATNEVPDRVYLFIVPYDAHGSSIAPAHYMFRPGSTTQLTADLKPGDTEIKVGSTANWYVGTSTNYYVTFWDYTDPGGKTWPKETYTKNIYARPYDAAAGPLPATSIPLESPWTGPLKTAGTWLSSGLSGGSFMYNALSNTLLSQEWTFYKSGIIGGIHTDPSNSAGRQFPLATASVKLGFLANYGGLAGAEQAYAGLDFSDVNAAQDMATSAMDSANARNRSVFSIGNATGTSLNGYSFINGDVWYRRGTGDSIIGMWEFQNGSWVSKTLNNQVIANLDAGKINAGTINAERIGANSIGAQKLIIGTGENIVNDPGFVAPIGENWSIFGGMSIVPEGVGGSNALKIVNNTSQQASYNNPQNSVFVEKDANYRITITFKSSTPVPSGGLTVGFKLIDPVTGQSSFPAARSVGVQPATNNYETVDLGIASIDQSGSLSWYVATQNNWASGTVWIDNISIVRATGTTMIADGAITTEKVHAEAITASELAAGAVTADKIKANEIDASKIVSGGMDGSVVIEEGTITATEIAGQTITGDKIQGNTIDAGHIKAGSITIGAGKPIAPGTVATPSDVSTAKSEAISTASGDATTKANAAQAAAIQAAATDAQTKADNAKAAAEQAAKDYADGEIDAATAQALIDAATTAQEKADAAYDAAENAAKGYTDGQVGPLNTAVTGINNKLGGWSHPTNTTFIDGGKIYTDSITAGQIAANAIGVSELAANAVTADKIAANSISAQKLVIGMGENFVNDPNFIANLGVNWATGAGITITNEGLNSSRSLKIVGSTAQQTSYNQPEDSIVVEAGTKIRATVRVKSTGTIPANVVGIGLRHKSLTGVVTYPAYLYIPAQAQISSYKSIDLGIANIPSDGTLTWFIVAQAGYSSRTIWFDNVQIMRAVGTTVIADDAITTGKIAAQQITGAKIAADTITVGNMGPNSVDRTVIKDGEIITSKLAADAVKAGNIDAGAIQAGHIAAGAITIGGTTGHIPSGAIADSGEVVPKISGIQGSKVFRDLATYHQSLNGVPGALIVRTPITFNNYMTSIKLSGYNYQNNMNNIDLTVSFYATTGSGGVIIQTTLNSTGLLPVEVTICKTNDTTPTVALIIKSKSNTGLWYYPKLNVDEAMIGQTSAPDSFKNGWSISHNATPDTDAEILAWTKVTPSGSGTLNQAETVRMAEGWAFTGTTEINGGKIKADTITAAQIKAGSITIGPNAPIAPGAVAVPSDVTNAVNPINNTLDAWSTDNRTYINGGAIKTRTIDATSIKANSIVIGAANSPIANVPGSTIQPGTVPTSAINNTQLTTYIDGNTKVTAGSNAATTLSGLTALQGGVTVIDGGKIKTDSITALQIDGHTITANEIKAGTITGTELTTDLAVVNRLKVQSSIEINHVNGHIKSSNYVVNGTTGFYMDQQQLIINQGKIRAAAIELQDSANIMPPLYASFNANASAYGVTKFWRGSLSGTTKVANDGKFGGGSVQFVITSNTGFVGMGASGTDLNIPIEGGNQYIISFYVSNRSSKVITLQPELYQTSAITIKGTARSIANSTAWVRHSVVVTAPASMTRAILRFNLTAGATATFKLDGIQVEQKTGAVDTPSNWSPPGYTSIDGESITTGSISSSSTARTNSAIAAWSIDTQGRARFGDVTVNGKIIVGEDVSNKEATSIQSDTYSAGLAGWAIKGNGDVEFNDGTFRGVLNLTSPGAGESAPTLTASVRPTNLYVTSSEKKMIHIAGIRGQVTGYAREEVGVDSGQYLPTIPDPNKRARYFIGPTTDRSLTIQVHDSSDIGDVAFLDNAPDDVKLSLINIGEITHPSEEPSDDLTQGFRHRSGSGDSLNYARVEQASTATTGTPEDNRSSHALSIESRSDLHKRTSQASLALNSDPAESHAASMNLSVTEFHESASGIVSDSAEYVWSPQGMSYPGTATPYMPTAVSILWDWSALSTSNRPHVGGSSKTTIINTGSWGRINTGEGRSYLDRFEGPVQKPLRGSWISKGSPAAYKDGGGRVRWAGGEFRSRTGIPSDYYVNSNALGSSNHDVTAQMDRWNVAFGVGWAAMGVIICSYDPVTGDGIFFRYKDFSGGQGTAAGIYVRKNGVTRTLWSIASSTNYGEYAHRLVRDGNTVRGYLNGTLVATVTDNNLPTGEHFGFALDAGQMKEIHGKALVPGSDARGIIEPGSMNINNRRGITVNTDGRIYIDAPGYYVVSAAIVAPFGGYRDRQYWMALRHSGGEYAIGTPAARYDSGGFTHMQGTIMGHMQGQVELVVMSNNISTESKMTHVRLEIARVA